ncbi:MAG: hypothetical protein D6759_06540 [Chloroflexi bacterium]|nr:MAG: hypothetical protein D6759_06540 [Chloroflexota bacterium]
MVRRKRIQFAKAVPMLIGALVILTLATGGCGRSASTSTLAGPAGNLPPAPAVGQVQPLIEKGGCGSCHLIPAIEGATGAVGPSWCDIAEEVQAGKKDVAFLRKSILDPNAEIAPGYPANLMPQNFGRLFTNEEIDLLVAFIANLQCE